MPPWLLETAHLQAIFEIDRTEPQPRRRLYPGLSSLAVVSTDLGRGAVRADVAIIGGGLGACAAALAAARLGRPSSSRRRRTGSAASSPTRRFRRTSTRGSRSSARPPATGCLREGIRDYYRAHLPLTPEARARRAAEPRKRVGEPALPRSARRGRGPAPDDDRRTSSPGGCSCMHPHRPILAWTDGDRITGVVVAGLESGARTR